jgi:hypothetical protein
MLCFHLAFADGVLQIGNAGFLGLDLGGQLALFTLIEPVIDGSFIDSLFF